MAAPIPNRLIQRLWPLLLIAALATVGYGCLFVGANFFVHEDVVAISNYSFGTAQGNGWRADKGLGISFFWGDPAIWHAWSPLVVVERLIGARVLAYNVSVLLLGILAAWSMYAVLRRTMPTMDRAVAALLAPLIVFCADQAGQHYLRVSISALAGIPLMLLLVHRHLEKPIWTNGPLAGLLFLSVAFLGTLRNLNELLVIGVVFAVALAIRRKRPLVLHLRDLAALYLLGGTIFVLLGAWILYPMLVELVTVGYLREKTYPALHFVFSPDLRGMIHYLVGLFTVDLAPANNDFALGHKPFLYVFNVLPAFPLIFLNYCARRAESDWEFGLKVLLLAYLGYMGLLLSGLVPGFREMVGVLGAKTLSLVSMYSLIFPFQILLIGRFVSHAERSGWLVLQGRMRVAQRWVAGALVIVYAALLSVAFLMQGDPSAVAGWLAQIGSAVLPAGSVAGLGWETLANLLAHDLVEYRRLSGWPMLAFILTSLLTIAPFLRDGWLHTVAALPKTAIAAALLINGMAMSWAIYPLNDQPLVWRQPGIASTRFEPTDRFLFVRPNRQESRAEILSRRAKELGRDEDSRKLGIAEAPGLNLSGLKSFASRDEAGYLLDAFNGDGIQRLAGLRTYYGGPLHVSPLLDMAAVKYYYSDAPLENLPEQLELFLSAHGVHIYRNRAAWPYYFLAKRVAPEPADWTAFAPMRETAYLAADSLSHLPVHGGGKVELEAFANGAMTFRVQSDAEELLVVADAWHPRWRAIVDSTEAMPVRVNRVFKGVPIPPGDHRVTLYFDTTPYRFGIHVSVVAWLFLIVGFIIHHLRTHRLAHVQR